jgi:predicted nucleotidyltransferase
MLDTLISSKTRVKLLLKFFLNSQTTAYLRNLETEFGESTNGIRIELNRFEESGLLSSFSSGNKKMFQANQTHPLFGEIQSIMRKYLGLDQVVENVVQKLGSVERVFVSGSFAKGQDGPILDLIFVGDIDKNYLIQLVEKSEILIKRKIRYLIYLEKEFQMTYPTIIETDLLLLWSR